MDETFIRDNFALLFQQMALVPLSPRKKDEEAAKELVNLAEAGKLVPYHNRTKNNTGELKAYRKGREPTRLKPKLNKALVKSAIKEWQILLAPELAFLKDHGITGDRIPILSELVMRGLTASAEEAAVEEDEEAEEDAPMLEQRSKRGAAAESIPLLLQQEQKITRLNPQPPKDDTHQRREEEGDRRVKTRRADSEAQPMISSSLIPAMVFHGFWTREDTKLHPKGLFIFGDNNQRSGNEGQAVIRGEPNAVGLRTKFRGASNPQDFYSDAKFDECCRYIDEDIATIKRRFKEGGYSYVVLPEKGFGTGLSELPERAPRVYSHLVKVVPATFKLMGEMQPGSKVTLSQPLVAFASPLPSNVPPLAHSADPISQASGPAERDRPLPISSVATTATPGTNMVIIGPVPGEVPVSVGTAKKRGMDTATIMGEPAPPAERRIAATPPAAAAASTPQDISPIHSKDAPSDIRDKVNLWLSSLAKKPRAELQELNAKNEEDFKRVSDQLNGPTSTGVRYRLRLRLGAILETRDALKSLLRMTSVPPPSRPVPAVPKAAPMQLAAPAPPAAASPLDLHRRYEQYVNAHNLRDALTGKAPHRLSTLIQYLLNLKASEGKLSDVQNLLYSNAIDAAQKFAKKPMPVEPTPPPKKKSPPKKAPASSKWPKWDGKWHGPAPPTVRGDDWERERIGVAMNRREMQDLDRARADTTSEFANEYYDEAEESPYWQENKAWWKQFDSVYFPEREAAKPSVTHKPLPKAPAKPAPSVTPAAPKQHHPSKPLPPVPVATAANGGEEDATMKNSNAKRDRDDDGGGGKRTRKSDDTPAGSPSGGSGSSGDGTGAVTAMDA